ncbi:MAG: hypothetical protein CVV47_06525 [Spirochaetae bacterium HGW-Spirochaetae-3]|jgi:hypothetical protein|nr:MAG: hypothetical protein CVV47_06525 [Spirochaetae bacterium HGW-Spirochaetae-3]
MAEGLAIILDVLETEFRGKSWNGLSLAPTLGKLGAAEAARTDTFEGYSAWSVALHCTKCKILAARDLGVAAPEWAFPAETWFPEPGDKGQPAWDRDRATLADAHDAMMAGLRAFPASSLGDEMPTWKSPWETVIAWLVTHDSFHGAQVRSMGLPTFRTKRHD